MNVLAEAVQKSKHLLSVVKFQDPGFRIELAKEPAQQISVVGVVVSKYDILILQG